MSNARALPERLPAERGLAGALLGPAFALHGSRDRMIAPVALAAATLALAGLVSWVGPLAQPKLPIAEILNAAISPMVYWTAPLTQAFSEIINSLLDGLVTLLTAIPWPLGVLAGLAIGGLLGGAKLAVFSGAAITYVTVTGYWIQSINTLALVLLAVALGVVIGSVVGMVGFWSRRARLVIEPALDMMQTIPTFAYLVPMIALFGFGPATGVIGSAIFAAPPFARNLMLGLLTTPPRSIEVAQIAGASRRQLLGLVRIPAALPSLAFGFSQTVMAAFSMVIIAALIGGIDDIGFEVLMSMRRAQFGQSLLAGAVIVLLAMVLDRWSRALIDLATSPSSRAGFISKALPTLIGLIFAGVALVAAARLMPEIDSYPSDWTVRPVNGINAAVTWLTASVYEATSAIKLWILFLLLLPLKIGFQQSFTSQFWGVEPSAGLAAAYFVIAAAAVLLVLRRSVLGAVVTGGAAAIMFFGLAGLPWPVVSAAASLAAWGLAGRGAGAFVLSAFLFFVLAGLWDRAMFSLALVIAGVLIAGGVGFVLGVAASRSENVSRLLRPVCDTFQTLPAFVYLVPVIMVFLIGEFSALVAIVAYAVIPAIRYTDYGLRNVPESRIEAARVMGCNGWTLFWSVRLPLAVPQLLLGMNQTVMFALAMLVIAALIGEAGLGQEIYLALVEADFGRGIVGGLAIALLAMSIDRTLRGAASSLRASATSPGGQS